MVEAFHATSQSLNISIGLEIKLIFAKLDEVKAIDVINKIHLKARFSISS